MVKSFLTIIYLISKQSMVFQCTGCEALTLQPLAIRKSTPGNPNSVKYGIPTGPFVKPNCEHCNHKHHVSSPTIFITSKDLRKLRSH